jgi:TorA maturation chaperone TorD
MSDLPESAAPTRQRAEAYWFLASLYGSPLAGGTLERLAHTAARLSVDEAGLAAELHAVLAAEADRPGLAERLATEHARLFLGLREGYGPPPPYESLWREGRILGDSTLAVAAAFSDAGFEDFGTCGPCDHIAHELRFLASLCHAEAEALSAGQADEAAWARGRQVAFLSEHLVAWVPRYCRRLAEHSAEPFYGALARVTEEVIAEDARQLGASTTPSAAALWIRSDIRNPEGITA